MILSVDKDEPIYKARRKHLVEELKNTGITSENVLKAISMVPRHLFIDSTISDFAYENKALQIGCGQTISQPFTVAFQTQLLDLKADSVVLEIGTGSGYQTAILSLISKSVVTIERQLALYEKTKKIFSLLKINNVIALHSDGFEGCINKAPFDRIIITAGLNEIPLNLLNQLQIEGLMVAPIGTGETKKICRIKRINEIEFQQEKFIDCKFVPMLKGIDNKPL